MLKRIYTYALTHMFTYPWCCTLSNSCTPGLLGSILLLLHNIVPAVPYSTYMNRTRLHTYDTYYVWCSYFYSALRVCTGTFPGNVFTYYLQKTLITRWVKYIITVLLIPTRNVVHNVYSTSYGHVNNTLHKLYVLYDYS